jgi:hypothetical protein
MNPKNPKNPTVLIFNVQYEEFFTKNVFLNDPIENLYVIECVSRIRSENVFKMSRFKISYEPKQYSGRFIVDLTNKNNPSMVF